jgi:hypothetical protein
LFHRRGDGLDQIGDFRLFDARGTGLHQHVDELFHHVVLASAPACIGDRFFAAACAFRRRGFTAAADRAHDLLREAERLLEEPATAAAAAAARGRSFTAAAAAAASTTAAARRFRSTLSVRAARAAFCFLRCAIFEQAARALTAAAACAFTAE